ncbi:MAG: metallopeptidase family protein [Chloroflexi bacterium]|nr:metallopeptidase family protein [Chloroflexota bacterium]
MTYRVSPEEFDGMVRDALRKYEPKFRERLQNENVVIVVDPEPSLEKLYELGLHAGETLFGLSEGVSLADGGSHNALMPYKITIFQHPIEDAVDSIDELAKEVRKTVWHEVGHFLGFDEDEVADMGLG